MMYVHMYIYIYMHIVHVYVSDLVEVNAVLYVQRCGLAILAEDNMPRFQHAYTHKAEQQLFLIDTSPLTVVGWNTTAPLPSVVGVMCVNVNNCCYVNSVHPCLMVPTLQRHTHACQYCNAFTSLRTQDPWGSPSYPA